MGLKRFIDIETHFKWVWEQCIDIKTYFDIENDEFKAVYNGLQRNAL